jgi:hypothetical protein
MSDWFGIGAVRCFCILQRVAAMLKVVSPRCMVTRALFLIIKEAAQEAGQMVIM